MNTLVLIRGLPGSGKSSIARQMMGYAHMEADMFFVRDGRYDFDPTHLDAAHHWCLRETTRLLGSGQSVVVSNTFITLAEMSPYLQLGYSTSIIEAKARFSSIHPVSELLLNRMADSWEELPRSAYSAWGG